MNLHVVGVRHHSPAAARLVDGVIRELSPRYVLIEGPADMNGRLFELLLPHELPIAIFTHYGSDERTHASWTPFCRHSPEWIALQTARDVGAEPLFMDLPAWTEAFAGIRNRYTDHHERTRTFVAALCARFRVDDPDTLWDHLFERPLSREDLAPRLAAYFEAIRADAAGDERDAPREDFMARCLAWAVTNAGGAPVVAVCGGFHAPVLPKLVADLLARGETSFPEVPEPSEGSRHGSYLVPYSFRRLDSFVGYESGLPSPAYYDAVWEHGPGKAAEVMLRSAAERLRARRQPVSSADLIACSTLAGGLSRLRGHPVLMRADLLDGIAGALVKDSLDVPLPWSYRGTILPRTDPVLVEVVAAFSGERDGKLAKGTPRPPLVDDVLALLEGHALAPEAGKRSVTLDLKNERERTRSRVLHRLRVLDVPGFTRVSGPEAATDAELNETWEIFRTFELESALIEAAAWGATLEGAAAARISDWLAGAGGHLMELARILGEAVFVGLDTLSSRLLRQVAQAVETEPSFGELGVATGRLLALFRHESLFGARGSEALGTILRSAFERGLWLVEGISGPTAAADEGMVAGVSSLRDLHRFCGATLALHLARADAVMERRAADREAPPALRGAAIGYLWSTGSVADAESRAGLSLREAALPGTFGDFLTGLFALAREEVIASKDLLSMVDEQITSFGGQDFLVALPSLRLAFSYFPPRERASIASLAASLHGGDAADPRQMLKLAVPAEEIARGLALEAEVTGRLERFGLAEVP